MTCWQAWHVRKAALLRLAAAMLCLIGSAEAQNAPKDKLSVTLQALAEGKRNEQALQAQLAARNRELESLRQKAARIAQQLQANERRTSAEEDALTRVNGTLSRKQSEFYARRSGYLQSLEALMHLRKLPLSLWFSSQHDRRELMQTMEVVATTHRVLAERAIALKQDLLELNGLRSEASARSLAVDSEREKLIAQQKNLEAALAQRSALVRDLSADHARAQETVQQLSRQSQNLQGLIAALERQQPPRRASAKPARRGQLAWPVAGRLLHRFGEAKSGGDHYRGWELSARAGATVVAPDDGEIAFAGPFRDYGTIVLIKHDSGLITLLAGVGGANVQLKQRVLRGEPVARIAEERGHPLYLELRDRDAKPIDPAEWFANVETNAAR